LVKMKLFQYDVGDDCRLG